MAFDTLDELLSLVGAGVSYLGFPPLLDDPMATADLLQFGGLYRGLFDLEVVPITPVPERTFYVLAQDRTFVVREQNRVFEVKA